LSANGWADVISVRQVRERSVRSRQIKGPRDAWLVLQTVIDKDATQESFAVLCLDTQNRVATVSIVTTGTLNSSLVHPREVFQRAILANAASIICGHNHPSGDADPSPEDLEITEQLVAAGRLLGIPVRDHVIMGDGSFTSLLEQGHIFNLQLEAKGIA